MPVPPSLPAFALFTVALAALLFAIDFASGLARVRSGTTPNAEDAATIRRGATVVAVEPEAVARVVRAHRNAMASVVPFLLAMLGWVLLGAERRWVVAVCGVFTGARVVHAVAYVAGRQPWRSLAFAIGFGCFAVTLVGLARAAWAVL
jgi:uncharacterized membrane protein YecN with MAPEG domain